MTSAYVLTFLLALTFAALGSAKVMGAPEMVARAEHLGFTTGAVVAHARNGDGVRHLLPAIVLAGLAIAYLGLAAEAVR